MNRWLSVVTKWNIKVLTNNTLLFINREVEQEKGYLVEVGGDSLEIVRRMRGDEKKFGTVFILGIDILYRKGGLYGLLT